MQQIFINAVKMQVFYDDKLEILFLYENLISKEVIKLIAMQYE